MRDWSPRSLWHALRETVERWMDESDADDVDPALVFHLAFTAPLLLGLIAMLRRL
jgi:hypothetical protein